MAYTFQHHTAASFLIGVLIGGGTTFVWQSSRFDHNHNHDHHPIADPNDGQYHVHADFHIVVRDTLVDLSNDQFQTTSQQSLHADAHLHGNIGSVNTFMLKI